MYIPPAFKEDDPQRIVEFLRQHPFATLISTNGAAPIASHVPLLHIPGTGDKPSKLMGHVARANPQWQQFESGTSVLAIFHGPHAYISPNWYEAEVAVPTWNYAAVHVYGTPALMTSQEDLWNQLQTMVETFEANHPQPWQLQLPGDVQEKLLDMIVGFEIEITHIEAQFKLGQNRSQADRLRMLGHLESSDHPSNQAVTRLVRRTLEVDE
ncbi:MAG: FMN-binding negative transcriptional regulator [Planctomycetaceae bacterium]|nr:FMN-binding negative transcriptional regulator [Planctomycetaceae bacterium]MCB9950263.1 FMN-binding negative transcriptional regulator [Planctomycetaceae bacterium]